MLPSPAWPKQGMRTSVLAAEVGDQSEEVWHASARNHDVLVQLQRGDGPQRRREFPPDPPDRLALLFARRAKHLGGPCGPAGRLHQVRLVGDRVRHPVHLENQQAGRPGRREFLAAEVAGQGRQALAVHKLERGRHHPGPDQLVDRLDGGLDAVEGGAQRDVRGRLRDEPEHRLGDDPERALRPDDHLRQVVADDALDGLRTGADHVPCRQDHLEAEHVALGGPVP